MIYQVFILICSFSLVIDLMTYLWSSWEITTLQIAPCFVMVLLRSLSAFLGSSFVNLENGVFVTDLRCTMISDLIVSPKLHTTNSFSLLCVPVARYSLHTICFIDDDVGCPCALHILPLWPWLANSCQQQNWFHTEFCVHLTLGPWATYSRKYTEWLCVSECVSTWYDCTGALDQAKDSKRKIVEQKHVPAGLLGPGGLNLQINWPEATRDRKQTCWSRCRPQGDMLQGMHFH